MPFVSIALRVIESSQYDFKNTDLSEPTVKSILWCSAPQGDGSTASVRKCSFGILRFMELASFNFTLLFSRDGK